MNGLKEHAIQCPWCGELQTILVDTSPEHQEYVEDCQVCCQPVLLRIRSVGDGLRSEVERENA
jgi:hypothetical protein